MASQTLIFVLLPNGVTPGKKLRVSTYLTPRLEGRATLASFPDLLAWTQRVQEHGLNFELRCVGKTQTVAAQQGFAEAGYLADDLQAEYLRRAIQGTGLCAAADCDLSLARCGPLSQRYLYQQVGSGTAGSEGNRGGLREVLGDLVFREGSKSTLADEISQKRVELWREQRDALDRGVANTPGGLLRTPIRMT